MILTKCSSNLIALMSIFLRNPVVSHEKNNQYEAMRRKAHHEVMHDRTHKGEKIKIVDAEIEKYEGILKRLGEDSASLREHYNEFIRLFEDLRTKIERDPSLDVRHQIALIQRKHNLFSDTAY